MHTLESVRGLFAAALAALLLAPAAGNAREESNIRVSMTPLGSASARGMLASQLAPGSASLRILVSQLAPNLEHVVMGESDPLARFTTNASGNAEVRIDLFTTGGGTTPSFDPRGKRVSVNDGVADVLEAWVYADPAQDPPRPRIKETTALARAMGVAQGNVDARYDALPSGGARFAIALRGVVPGTYDVLLDGAPLATLTTNPSGAAFVDLRVLPGQGGTNGNAGGNGKGKGAPHKHVGPLTGNPRDALIEVMQADAVHFSGPMRAQIPGLGVCTASSANADLTRDPAQSMGSGSVTRGVEASCDVEMTVSVADLAPGDYDLAVGATETVVVNVPAGGAASFVFDEHPEAGEQPLPDGAVSGASISIVQRPPLGTATVLSGALP
jgi:hypothetical protein